MGGLGSKYALGYACASYGLIHTQGEPIKVIHLLA